MACRSSFTEQPAWRVVSFAPEQAQHFLFAGLSYGPMTFRSPRRHYRALLANLPLDRCLKREVMYSPCSPAQEMSISR